MEVEIVVPTLRNQTDIYLDECIIILGKLTYRESNLERKPMVLGMVPINPLLAKFLQV